MAERPLLVLLPGLDGTGRLFAPFLAALGDGLEAEVVTYPPDRVFGYRELLERARPGLPRHRPYALVAESFSGPIALRLAAEAPPGLVAVVLVASFHRRPVGRWLAALRPLAELLVARRPPAWAVRLMLAGRDAPGALVAAFQDAAASVRGDVLARRVREALAVDASEALAAGPVPLLFLAGTEDRLLRPRLVDEARRLRPSAEVRSLPCAHLVLQARPREAAALIDEFLSRVATRGAGGARGA